MGKVDKRILANWHWILLGCILLLALNLRLYHLDYPVIGYHNMKEAHTLMEARHFLEDGDYLVNRLDYNSHIENPESKHVDNFPLYTWLIMIIWKITGINIAVARFITILFSLGTIFLTYLVTNRLYKRDDIALLSAFFLAVMPLNVFFGKTVFFDVPALFFMMLSLYYFLCWKQKALMKYFTFFVVALTLAALSKMVYLIIVLPMLAIFPYERVLKVKNLKKYYKQYLLGLVLPISYLLYSNVPTPKVAGISTGSVLGGIFEPTKVAEFFTGQFWKTIYMYATVDNFSKLGVFIMLIGFVISLFYLKRESSRFMTVWFISVIPYAFMVGWRMRGHNYYQFPFLPLVGILIAYTLLFLFNSVIPKFKQKFLREIIIGACLLGFFMLFMYPSIKLSTTRQFDTQFVGIDVAGEFVREHSDPDTYIFGSGHQDSGFYWYADRKGRRFPQDLTDFKHNEEEMNIQWLFIYQWGFGAMQDNPELWEYVQKNYQLRQVGMTEQGEQMGVLYFVMQKGGTFNESLLNSYLEGKPMQSKDYEFSNKNVRLLWTDV